MSVTYQHYFIPETAAFHPTSDKLTTFIQGLVDLRFIVDERSFDFGRLISKPTLGGKTIPGYVLSDRRTVTPSPASATFFEQFLHSDMIIRWQIIDLSQTPVRHPVELFDIEPAQTWYNIQLELSHDYIYRTGDGIESFPSTRCGCGAELEFYERNTPFYTSKIRSVCPECGLQFDPSTITVELCNGFTGNCSRVPGGATSKFALVVDCDKCVPLCEVSRLHPDLAELCVNTFGCKFRDVINAG